MFQKIIQGFSKYSHKSKIPNLLKDGRYTKRGFHLPKPPNRIHRKPDIPEDIPNAHLYYDYTKGLQKYETLAKNTVYESTELEFNLGILNNEKYIQQQDMRLFKAMKQINIHHPKEVKNNWESFDRAFNLMLGNLRYLDIYGFRSFTQISQQYYIDNEKVWTTLYRNAIQFIVAWEHEQTPLLSKKIDKTYQQSFLYSFNIIMKQARRFNVDIKNFIIHLDYLMRNHLRFDKIHGIEVYNKWENVEDKNQLGNFLAHFAFCIQQRSDFFNEVDKEVKQRMVQDFLFQGQKLCLESIDKLTKETKQNLFNSITYERYIYKPLFEKLK